MRLARVCVLSMLLAGCAGQIAPGDAIDGTATMVGPTEATACDAATLTAGREAQQSRPFHDRDDLRAVYTSPCRCMRMGDGGWNCAVDYRLD